VLAYVRRAAGAPEVIVVMNMSAREQAIPVDRAAKTLAESDAGVRVESGKVVLPAFTAWVGQK
jgi:hypothetical protein